MQRRSVLEQLAPGRVRPRLHVRCRSERIEVCVAVSSHAHVASFNLAASNACIHACITSAALRFVGLTKRT
ncbi:hypothetical protein AN651_03175 [Xanthomonas arboricola]|nr:hypothetical protein AN651_03175 [Xanthomonas arboricola]